MAQDTRNGRRPTYEGLPRGEYQHFDLELLLSIEETQDELAAKLGISQENLKSQHDPGIADLFDLFTRSSNTISVEVGSHIHNIEVVDEPASSAARLKMAERFLRRGYFDFVNGDGTAAPFDDLDWWTQSSVLSFATRPVTDASVRLQKVSMPHPRYSYRFEQSNPASAAASNNRHRIGLGINPGVTAQRVVSANVLTNHIMQGCHVRLGDLVFDTKGYNDKGLVYQISWPWKAVLDRINMQRQTPLTTTQILGGLSHELAASAHISLYRACLLLAIMKVGPNKPISLVLVPRMDYHFAHMAIGYFRAKLRVTEGAFREQQRRTYGSQGLLRLKWPLIEESRHASELPG